MKMGVVLSELARGRRWNGMGPKVRAGGKYKKIIKDGDDDGRVGRTSE